MSRKAINDAKEESSVTSDRRDFLKVAVMGSLKWRCSSARHRGRVPPRLNQRKTSRERHTQ